jgi:3-methyladenine DNA glycosylase AlkD
MKKIDNKPIDISAFLSELRSLGSTVRAARDQRYHKSKREHWGVPVPECSRLVRDLSKKFSDEELIVLSKDLWATNLFDPMVCAAKILSIPRLKPSKQVWNTTVSFLQEVDGWALEDHLAHVAWKCILHDESLLDELERWTKHTNFWMRRATLVYTLPYAKPGRNSERMLRWASFYISDPEWFIQKAIGWWLRVLGEHNPERVIQFLVTHWPELKAVAKKESTRKLSSEWQMRLSTQREVDFKPTKE